MTETTPETEGELKKKSRRFATRRELFAMAELMKKHLQSAGDGLFAYDEEWSDARVAETTAPGLVAHHARDLREELHGKLRPAATAGGRRSTSVRPTSALTA